MKYLMKPLFLIVALLSVWSSQAMASLSEADVQRVIDVQRDPAGKELTAQIMDDAVLSNEEKAAMWEDVRRVMKSDGPAAASAVAQTYVFRKMFPEAEPEQLATLEGRHELVIDRIRSDNEMNSAFTDVVQGHGFSDLDEWGEVALQVTKATHALKFEAYEREINASIEQIRNSPQMNEEQIAQVIAAQNASIAQLREQTEGVSEADKRVVAPFMEELSEKSILNASESSDSGF
ncbi:hypothetical protein [Marinobacter xestospongiae]|uniref:hypothetical protein n=1 Tax=Marinobacter xestospongiae TaxID=994319 RepID=UPI0020036C6F|nr:hypothetical protein [Marinobacter xestospongiae]MCK7566875.1 hypothetical protein [Marinobacter xestospongiae]